MRVVSDQVPVFHDDGFKVWHSGVKCGDQGGCAAVMLARFSGALFCARKTSLLPDPPCRSVSEVRYVCCEIVLYGVITQVAKSFAFDEAFFAGDE